MLAAVGLEALELAARGLGRLVEVASPSASGTLPPSGSTPLSGSDRRLRRRRPQAPAPARSPRPARAPRRRRSPPAACAAGPPSRRPRAPRAPCEAVPSAPCGLPSAAKSSGWANGRLSGSAARAGRARSVRAVLRGAPPPGALLGAPAPAAVDELRRSRRSAARVRCAARGSTCASISRASGSSLTSMSESENGWIGSRGWPITSAGGSSVRRSSRGGAVRPKNRPWSTDADGLGSWLAQSSSICPSSGPRRGTRARPAADRPGDRRAEGERQQQRGEARSRSPAARCRAPASRSACPGPGPGRRPRPRAWCWRPATCRPARPSPARGGPSARAPARRRAASSSATSPTGGRSRRGRAGRCTRRGSRASPASRPAARASCARTAARASRITVRSPSPYSS